MKTAVSIPDDLFRSADELARRRRMARSALYAEALREFLEKHAAAEVTEQLNRVYASQSSRLEPGLRILQFEAVPDEEW